MLIGRTDYNVDICGKMSREQFEEFFPNDKKAYDIIQKSLGKKQRKEVTEQV